MDSKEDNVTEKKEGHDDTQSTTSETKTALENEKTENSPLVSQPDYGEPEKYDPSFKGPIADRGCTDVICCLLFVACFIAFVGVAIFAFARGDPRMLLYPTDSEGNICGYGQFESKNVLFFFDLLACARAGPAIIFTGCPTPQVCREKCPETHWAWLEQAAIEKTSNSRSGRSSMICKYGVDPTVSAQLVPMVTLCLPLGEICVKECPEDNWVWQQQYYYEMYLFDPDKSGRNKMICRPKVDPLEIPYANQSIQQLVQSEQCAAYYLESKPVVSRCVPSFLVDAVNYTVSNAGSGSQTIVDMFNRTVNGTDLQQGTKYLALLLNAQQYGINIIADLRATWWLMLIALIIAMLVALLWIVLMRWLAAPMVWLMIIIFIGLFAFGTYYCFSQYVTLRTNPENNKALVFSTDVSSYFNNSNTWLAFGIIAAILLLIVIIVLLFLRERIRIAIALIKEASRALGYMLSVLAWPIIPFVLQFALFAFWGAQCIFLASTAQQQFALANSTTNSSINNSSTNSYQNFQQGVNQAIDMIPCNPNDNTTGGEICHFLKYGGDSYTIYLQFFQLFMLFWVMNFIVALGQMTLAGAFASYYWAFKKPEDLPYFPVAGSLWRCFRYHLGTIAFGSLIIAIVQIIRVILEYIDHKLKGSENAAAKFFIKCLKCCFWCLEKILKFINKNAYIMTAVYGYNFCTAARKAFFLIMRNIIRVAVVDKVTDFLLFIGKVMVVGGVGTLAFFFFSGRIAPVYTVINLPPLNYYLVPVIVICVGSFVIASSFFNVYSMGVDTLFLCFLMDSERNDGSLEKPYYMSKELMNILGKKNEIDKHKK